MHFLKINVLRCINAVGCIKKRCAPRCIHKMQAIPSVNITYGASKYCYIPIRNLLSWQRREWLKFISRPSISAEGHHWLSNHFRLFPMREVPLSRCWRSSEMSGILYFKIVGIPIKACAAQLSFHVFPLTNQYWHH